jgi:O-antigen ligase
LLAAFLVVSDMAGDALARRMGSVATAFDDRLAVYSIVAEAIRSNPWTGFGLGAFEDLFPLYRDARAGYGGVWNAAHNTYLELMASVGIPAALAFLGSIAIVAGRCAAGAIIRQKHATPALVATATTAQLGLHSLFDFPLQIHAIALFYAAILGAGLAQAYPSGDRMLASGKSMRRPS